MDSKRLSEIEADIAVAERRIAAAVDAERTDIGAGRGTKAVYDAHHLVQKGLNAGLEILQAKRVNVAAGLPEDHGLAAPIDMERMVKAAVAAFKEDLINALAEVHGGLVERLNAFRKAVRKDLDEMKQARGLRYRGVFQPAEDYGRGDLVTLDGALWHANTETRAVPGKSTEWQLAVKSGGSPK